MKFHTANSSSGSGPFSPVSRERAVSHSKVRDILPGLMRFFIHPLTHGYWKTKKLGFPFRHAFLSEYVNAQTYSSKNSCNYRQGNAKYTKKIQYKQLIKNHSRFFVSATQLRLQATTSTVVVVTRNKCHESSINRHSVVLVVSAWAAFASLIRERW